MNTEESLAGGELEFVLNSIFSSPKGYTQSPADGLRHVVPAGEAGLLRRSNRPAQEHFESHRNPESRERESEGFVVVPMNDSTRNKEQYHIGAKKVVKARKKQKTEQRVFLESAAWFTVQAIIISFFTEDILDSVQEWRTGYQVIFLFIAVLVFWWRFLRPLIRDYGVSAYDEGSRWDRGIHATSQLITSALFIITAQYAARLLRDSWNVRSFSPTDRIAQIFVIALILGDVLYTVREAEKLHAYDQNNEE